jgi:rhamnogalacturonyl hydrolase YesR
LFAGSIEYFKSKGNYDSLNNVITLFDHYVDKDGFPTFKLNKIDQVAWGVSAIELFKYTNNKKYKFFANKLFDFLIKNQNKNGIILYRQGAQQYLNDTLGMICPFLIKYGVAFDNEDALHLAYVNINYFIEYGLDSESRLPFHAFDLESKLKFGPCNWGRGIGWYTIALFYLLKYTNISNNPYYLQHLREYNAVEKVLSKEFTANLWPQFIGQKNIFDSSCSTLFLHSFPKFSESAANKKIIFSCLKEHTTQNGFLFSSSGECMGINRYSLAISFSELSQGMLLYYLAASE